MRLPPATSPAHRVVVFLGACIVLALPAWLPAQTLEPIRYTLSFPSPLTHYVEVEAQFPTEGQPQIDLMMPVWTPGSYLVREYARNIEGLAASGHDRSPLRVDKTRKNRWRVQTDRRATVVLRYRVYAHEMSVRTNWVDEEFALLNGAPTFITLLGSPRRQHDIRLQLPSGWVRSVSGLAPGPDANTYVAPDYDTLVDSPIVAGNPAVYEFRVAGKPHYLVNVGERGVWDGAKAVKDLARVVEQTTAFWAQVPYERYYFFNIIGGANGGLEHLNSTVLNTTPASTGTRETYLQWLSTAAHEHFHAWNVKRLRPVELGPFDYENEVYTKGLWFAEGVTDYYADLLVRRAGVSTSEEYLSALSREIAALQTTPGQLVQPAEMASYDAWIKYYRPDENSVNTSISYYTKGSIIGFLLDAKIRKVTSGARSLDDLMRLMYQRFSGESGFTSEDLRRTTADVVGSRGGGDLRSWLVKALETTEELDYADALAWYGLAFQPAAGTPRAWLGVRARIDNQRTIVSEVRRGSPAGISGLDVGDEIVTVNRAAIPPGQLADQLGQFQPGTPISVEISRHGATRRLDIVLESDPAQAWSLVSSSDARPDQAAHLRTWLEN